MLRKIALSALIIAATFAASTAKAGIYETEEGSAIVACFSFSEYLDIFKTGRSGASDLAMKMLQNSDSCIVLKSGVQYAVIDKNDRWHEIMLSTESGTASAYTFPFAEHKKAGKND